MPGKKLSFEDPPSVNLLVVFYIPCTSAGPDGLAEVPGKNYFEDPPSVNLLLVFSDLKFRRPIMKNWQECSRKKLFRRPALFGEIFS
jgi:hypothetical protein